MINSKVADFINNHEDEIDSNDFHSVFTAAYNELDNEETRELFYVFADTFDAEEIKKQRETALYFIITKIVEDIEPNTIYFFSDIYIKLMHENILGLRIYEFGKYLDDNIEEFNLERKTINHMSAYSLKEV